MSIDWMCLLKAVGCAVATILMAISTAIGISALMMGGTKNTFQKIMSAYGVLAIAAMIGLVVFTIYQVICP